MGEPTTFDSAVRSVTEQFVIVLSAPIPFLLVIAFITVGIWKIIGHHYSGINASKDELLKLRDAQIQDYKDKLSGATPDEAKARLDDLENKVVSFEKHRLLTHEQKSIIANLIRNVIMNEKFCLIYPSPSEEAARYAQDFEEALQLGGWDVEVDTMTFGRQRVDRQGITLAVPDLQNKTDVAKILSIAFVKAGIPFSWGKSDHDDIRLYIDMRD